MLLPFPAPELGLWGALGPLSLHPVTLRGSRAWSHLIPTNNPTGKVIILSGLVCRVGADPWLDDVPRPQAPPGPGPHLLPGGVSNLQPEGRIQPRMAMNVAQLKTVNLLKTFVFAHQFSLVFVYLMCGPSQLFCQCGPEMPKGWTPLSACALTTASSSSRAAVSILWGLLPPPALYSAAPVQAPLANQRHFQCPPPTLENRKVKSSQPTSCT